MFKLLCVTNRALACEVFFERLTKIAVSGADAIILREKDMSEDEYFSLAKRALQLPIPVILHSFLVCAKRLDADFVHLPFPLFLRLSVDERKSFSAVGVSCHTFEEAKRAEELGASYLTAGHIFETDCKRGVPARGLKFLEEICFAVHIPVFAIGGISAENIRSIQESGADGACVMSGAMCCEDPKEYFDHLRNAL